MMNLLPWWGWALVIWSVIAAVIGLSCCVAAGNADKRSGLK